MRCALLLLTVLAACAVACGPGGGSSGDGPILPPAEPIPALEGLWCGPAGDHAGLIGAICIKIDANGTISRIVFEAQTVDAIGTIQSTSEPRVYRFALTNGGQGFFMLSQSESHLLYLDNTQVFAVLDSTSGGLPTYARDDIRDDWGGASLLLDTTGAIIATPASSLSVLPAFGFNGIQGLLPFQEQTGTSIAINQFVFGRYVGRYTIQGVTSGDLWLLMSPDKACVGGSMCADGAAFPENCPLVLWERAP